MCNDEIYFAIVWTDTISDDCLPIYLVVSRSHDDVSDTPAVMIIIGKILSTAMKFRLHILDVFIHAFMVCIVLVILDYLFHALMLWHSRRGGPGVKTTPFNS